MKAFVTGGTGFLGINLVQQLVALNWQVTALHRKGSDISELAKLNVHLVQGVLTDIESIQAAMPNDVDIVFHLAGDTSLWQPNNGKQFTANVTGTENLLKVASEKQVKRFIHTSSISAYGFHDDFINEQTVSTALDCGVNYLKTKYLGEQAVKKAVKDGLIDAVILNPCAIMGPYDKHNWSQLFSLISKDELPGVPSGEGSYCHVREVAKAHISAVEKGKTGENYILAGTDMSFLEVVTKIGKLLDKHTPNKVTPSWAIKLLGSISYWWSLISRKEPNMTPEKALMVTKRVVASSEKAVIELGYNDRVSIDEMLQDCYDWLKAQGRLEG